MRSLKKIFSKPRAEPAPIQEIPVTEVESTARPGKVGEVEPIYVKSMELNSLADVQEAADELRAGNIIILDISSLMNHDPQELKQAIDQLKGICQGIGGDMGRLTETKVIATPKYISLQFRKPAT
ncbi:MAG: cell division protein SepF [Candidatus Hadarchaeum sp.]|uniref:cell division protein SepF n=1 Tax=Candidatus Hadarchaeum sp. TaxID=2883567 RepID=UPI003177F331